MGCGRNASGARSASTGTVSTAATSFGSTCQCGSWSRHATNALTTKRLGGMKRSERPSTTSDFRKSTPISSSNSRIAVSSRLASSGSTSPRYGDLSTVHARVFGAFHQRHMPTSRYRKHGQRHRCMAQGNAFGFGSLRCGTVKRHARIGALTVDRSVGLKRLSQRRCDVFC